MRALKVAYKLNNAYSCKSFLFLFGQKEVFIKGLLRGQVQMRKMIEDDTIPLVLYLNKLFLELHHMKRLNSRLFTSTSTSGHTSQGTLLINPVQHVFVVRDTLGLRPNYNCRRTVVSQMDSDTCFSPQTFFDAHKQFYEDRR